MPGLEPPLIYKPECQQRRKPLPRFKARFKWLSIEPMLEPLTFTRLDLFDWIVVGGASKQSQTPEWKPPFIWIYDLMNQWQMVGKR